MITVPKPGKRPLRPYFSSGPTVKRPGFSLAQLENAALGRSHRSNCAKARLKQAIERTKALLSLPDGYRVAIVPASDTGAVEMCMWSMLGARATDIFAWESFGRDWIVDAVEQLRLDDCNIHTADYGALPDFAAVRDDADIVFTWNGTTSGVRVPDANWIRPGHDRIVICDATSAVFAQDIDWHALDAVTYSWQKVLGGEAGHGMLILSPNAVRRLETFTPLRPLPKIFRMTEGGTLNEKLFEGVTINTPSMLAVEDYLKALDWAEACGGYKGLQARSQQSLSILTEWEARTGWVSFLCPDPAIRSNTGVTFKIADPVVTRLDQNAQRRFVARMMARLETENVCHDAAAYAKAPAGLRIWCGATVEPDDTDRLTPWLDWAFAHERAAL